jgi:Fic family protein
MTFIHESPDWPHFTWAPHAVADSLAAVRHKLGNHLGLMQSLGFGLKTEAGITTLVAEIVKSSAIEGEKLDTEEVRSSIARKLGLEAAGLPKATREVDGIVEMMLDATRHCDEPLTAERLWGWHAALFPTGRSGLSRITVGAWRTDEHGPMQVVSGPLGHERVHFEGPAAPRLAGEMQHFLDWFNGTSTDYPPLLMEMDAVLKAAVAHLWFVTIHPFDDGNGRIARAVAELALARADGSKERFYSMSWGIEATRREYYLQLESTQRGSMDITSWLAWFLGCLDRSLDASEALTAAVFRKARLWQRLAEAGANERQRAVVNRMLEPDWVGYLSTAKYATLAKCSHDTALRDIKELLAWGLVVRNEAGGRSTSYRVEG